MLRAQAHGCQQDGSTVVLSLVRVLYGACTLDRLSFVGSAACGVDPLRSPSKKYLVRGASKCGGIYLPELQNLSAFVSRRFMSIMSYELCCCTLLWQNASTNCHKPLHGMQAPYASS